MILGMGDFGRSVPQTDEAVFEIFETQYSGDIGAVLSGIYRCRRARGSSVLEAFEYTLRTYVEVHDKVHGILPEQS